MITGTPLMQFLKELFFMPLFQLGIVATIGGLILADWFCTTVLKLSAGGRLFAWIIPFGSSMLLCITVCYRQFIRNTAAPKKPNESISGMVQNLISLLPLLVGIGFVIEPLIAREYGKSWLILLVAIVAWAVLKLLMRGMKRDQGRGVSADAGER